MNFFFGIFHRDGSEPLVSDLYKMHRALVSQHTDSPIIARAGMCAIGTTSLQNVSGYPLSEQSHVVPSNFIFASSARIDNRKEIIKRLSDTEIVQDDISDETLLEIAYLRWGAECVSSIFGDWSFAAWHPENQQLFIARDHIGVSSLYYYSDEKTFAFAPTRNALLALNLSPLKLNELYLAQVLVSWSAYQGECTVHNSIYRLPPAHCITISPEKSDVKQYWFLERTPLLILPRRTDYVEAFKEHFDNAVSSRLEISCSGNQPARVGVTLSGGLDSGAVAATAAGILSSKAGRLDAFTAIPLSDTNRFTSSRYFGNELQYAEATARFHGNIDHHAITSKHMSPIQGIRWILDIIDEPAHAAGNFYWMVDLFNKVKESGCNILLTGQMGNAGISWQGDVFSQSLSFQLQQIRFSCWLKEKLKRKLPNSFMSRWYKHFRSNNQFLLSSAIRPEFAKKIGLPSIRYDDPNELPSRTSLQKRSFLKPGRSIAGSLYAELSAAHRIEIRDPTADARVLAFTFSVPDNIFIEPESGTSRWLIREAMKGRLPENVRLNTSRGRQAADLVPRLRATSVEVEQALNEVASGPAADFLNIPLMWESWHYIQHNDTPEAYSKAVSILTRGIMAGLFVNRFYQAV